MSNRRISLFLLGATLVGASVRAQSVTLNKTPSRVVGHAKRDLVTASPNLVDSRAVGVAHGIAVDKRSDALILYVGDTLNNRVLGWRDATNAANGAPADLIIGQVDQYATFPGGPGIRGTPAAGLQLPSGLAVDAQGNLYVVDTGSSRILRYPRPFEQTGDIVSPDMVIGQTNFSSRGPNPGGVSEKAIATAQFDGTPTGYPGMTFDADGNLWFSDNGNNRVLRYPAAALAQGANQPAADIVLGQPDFKSNGLAPVTQGGTPAALNKSFTARPTALTFDDAGRLYVCDAYGRILVYAPNPRTGSAATRLVGLDLRPNTTSFNEYTLGAISGQSIVPAQGVFFMGGTLYAVDTPVNRILRYDPFVSWAPESSTQISPPARVVYGQADYVSFKANGGKAEPTAAVFASPSTAAVAGENVFLLDGGNSRVLHFRAPGGTLLTNAERVFGQIDFPFNSPNLIEGRELFISTGAIIGLQNGGSYFEGGGGIVIDRKSSPPHLYISDPLNNRILGYRDVRNVRPGDKADIVIGQRDFYRSLVNEPANDVNQLTNQGLFSPQGVALDAAGNLYVADSGNGRVLRYPLPFDQTDRILPDLVLGQADYFSKSPDATSRTMGGPYGLAFTQDGSLFVSDLQFSRVLFFRRPAGGDFTSGMAAEKVFGQPDFLTTTFGSAPNKLFAPHHIATDSSDRLYVCDTGNNRVVIFDRAPSASSNPVPSLQVPNLRSPHGVTVNQDTGEIWVTDTLNFRILRYPPYDIISLLPIIQNDNDVVGGNGTTGFPLAVALDGYGNLLVADSANRIALYYPALQQVLNGANILYRPLAPGMIAVITANANSPFSDTTVDVKDIGNPVPLPTNLNDTQVLVNDVPAPLMRVAPNQITFIVPKSTPTSDTAEIQVVRVSTGQLIAVRSDYLLDRVSPGFFTVSSDGKGQLLAFNQDGSQNSTSNKAARGETITVLGTGVGLVDGMPDDGMPASGEIPTSGRLVVVISSTLLNASDIVSSALAPDMIGVWKLVVKIPMAVPPSDTASTQFVASYDGVASNVDLNGARVVTTIAVK
jgi:uncharacterized protein (TIGR03437 family)